MTRNFLVVDCYIRERSGIPNFVRALGDHPVTPARATLGELPRSLDGFAGLLITGSAASVHDARPWIPHLAHLVRQAWDRGVPTFGICFGHQVIAATIDGADAVGKATAPEVGWPEIRIASPDPLFDVLPRTFRVFSSHEDEVRPGSRRLDAVASSDGCAVQALRAPDRPMWSVQFHPEMELEEMTSIVNGRRDKHPELDLDVHALLATATDGAPLADALFSRFVELASDADWNRLHKK